MYNMFFNNIQIPVPPPKMTMTINNKNETVTLINEGEVNILKKPGLTDIQFELVLPNNRYPYAVYPNGYQPASYYLDVLEQLKVSQEPFQFILNRTKPDGSLLFDTNMTVSLEEYVPEDDAEEGFDIRVAITLKQFKPFGTKKLVIQQVAGVSTVNTKVTVEKTRSIQGKQKPKMHTVKKGDTLWAIAKRYLGDGSKYPQLAKLNNMANPNVIKVGQVIRLE
ncbi:LysM peptidoglycan-binding domain-containing protein [Lysinibacillus sp. LZ02]|uniref:LysM peptidoglycan-binding domain-containing protein n=1 Tax=Lysinibacillus sp. LZ02 TaxID=3420668 RepID=UPI003D35B1B0